MPTLHTELENVISTLTSTKEVTIVYPFYHSPEQLCLYAHAAVATTCFVEADGWFDVLAHSPELGRVASRLKNADSREKDVDDSDGWAYLFFADVGAAMGIIYGYGDTNVNAYLQGIVKVCEQKAKEYTPKCKKLEQYKISQGHSWTAAGAILRAKEWLKLHGLSY